MIKESKAMIKSFNRNNRNNPVKKILIKKEKKFLAQKLISWSLFQDYKKKLFIRSKKIVLNVMSLSRIIQSIVKNAKVQDMLTLE